MRHPENWPFAHPTAGLPNDCDSGFLSDPHLRSIPEDRPLETIRTWALSAALTAELQRTAAALNYT